jgi:molybdopterin molybdotransferase
VISVEKAYNLILARIQRYGSEKIDLEESLGRVLANPIYADRDYPPFNRATMDGIAISYDSFSNNQNTYKIKAVLAAGQAPIEIDKPEQCIQIMTGASLPESVDTVVPIEELIIKNKSATIISKSLRKGQFVHLRGSDKHKGDVVVEEGHIITPDIIPVLSSVGSSVVSVSKLPRYFIITTGDDLIDNYMKPSKYQIRRSNDYAIWAILQKFGIQADRVHELDDKKSLKKSIKKYIKEYDVVLISGGVSKGKFDYVQIVLEELLVKKIFHGVTQKPGKPMWFGVHASGTKVFAFPGNPVSTFLCLLRYFEPWLRASLGVGKSTNIFAVLENDIKNNELLTQFVQVKLHTNSEGILFAHPLSHNGSGDFISLVEADAFIELPPGKAEHKKGEVRRAWIFKGL